MMITDILRIKNNRNPIFAIMLSDGIGLHSYYGIWYTIDKYTPQKFNNYREGYEFEFGWH